MTTPAADNSSFPGLEGLPPSIVARVHAVLAKRAAKQARKVPWAEIVAAREELWRVQSELKRALRTRTGMKWAVICKRAESDPDLTVTFRPHWKRLPTPLDLAYLPRLLGKPWGENGIALSLGEAVAFLERSRERVLSPYPGAPAREA